jgi:hypothetical protein
MKNKNLQNLVSKLEEKNKNASFTSVELLPEDQEKKIMGGYRNRGCSCSKNSGCYC